MAISSKKSKHSLAYRLTIIQITLIVLVSVSLLVSCWIILDRYIVTRSRIELEKSADILANLLPSDALNWVWSDYPLTLMRRLPFQTINIHYLIVDNNNLIVASTLGGDFMVGNTLPQDMIEPASNTSKLQYKGYLYAYAPIILANGQTQGQVIALGAQNELIMVRRTILWLVIRILIVVVVIGFFFSNYLMQRVVKPLKDLKSHADRISERDFSSKIENISEDELGDLARAFNMMGDKLYLYNQAQARFVQNASHELKSPLMSIQGYAEGLEEGIFNQHEQAEALHVIISECQRLKNVVEELLYLSKIESDSERLNLEEVALSDLINGACQIVYNTFKHKDITLKVDIPESLVLLGSYDHLVRAIANVLDNASRYAQHQVEIQGHREKSFLVLAIIDDGLGFSEEDIKHVFERFYKGEHGETGLGMAITKDIIDAHQGKIVVGNVKGKGAVVKFYLPLRKYS